MTWTRVVPAARVALGLLFTTTGLGGFLGLFPLASPHAFQAILIESGWMKVEKAIELGAGLLLLSNRFVPLALALLAPVVAGLAGRLLGAHRRSFRGVLERDARPGA